MAVLPNNKSLAPDFPHPYRDLSWSPQRNFWEDEVKRPSGGGLVIAEHEAVYYTDAEQTIPADGMYHRIQFAGASTDTGNVVTATGEAGAAGPPFNEFYPVADGYYSILLLLNFYDNVFPETATHYPWDFTLQLPHAIGNDGWSGPAFSVEAMSAFEISNQQAMLSVPIVWLYGAAPNQLIYASARQNTTGDAFIHQAELVITRPIP